VTWLDFEEFVNTGTDTGVYNLHRFPNPNGKPTVFCHLHETGSFGTRTYALQTTAVDDVFS
jgi:hypothetical protein